MHAVILAIVQGITEFLPISSSAHLILVPLISGWEDQGVVFDVALHFGTLLAVMVYFRHEVATLCRGKYDVVTLNFKTEDARLLLLLAASTVPIVLIAPFAKDFLEDGARSYMVLGVTSIVFGLLLWVADKQYIRRWVSFSGLMGWLERTWPKGRLLRLYRFLAAMLFKEAHREILGKKLQDKHGVENINFTHAMVFGFFQVLAIIPGTSRSGICMTAGRMLGFDRETTNRYAMLMAIPVIVLAVGYTLIADFDVAYNWQNNWDTLLVGVGLSFFFALLAIHFLMHYVVRNGFLVFVVYRIFLGTLLMTLAIN